MTGIDGFEARLYRFALDCPYEVWQVLATPPYWVFRNCTAIGAGQYTRYRTEAGATKAFRKYKERGEMDRRRCQARLRLAEIIKNGRA